MRIPFPITAAAMAAVVSLASMASAQVRVFGGADADRRSSTIVMFGEHLRAGISISYSTPTWQSDYDKEFDKLKGKNLRLGKNWWTSLDTSVGITFGNTKIDAGSYFLGLHCDDKGAFTLLVFDAKKCMETGLMPFGEENWKGEVAKVPLNLKKDHLKEVADKMVISISADSDEPTKGKFSIQWGKHELGSDLKFQLPKPKDG